MKTLLKLFSILILVFCTLNFAYAQIQPTFNAGVRNFRFGDTLGGSNNVLFFDIHLLHTNYSQSGPFELALNMYYWNFNIGIANGGTLNVKKVPNSSEFTNPDAIPRSPFIMPGWSIGLPSNVALGAGNGPIISTISPGTRVVTLRLATTASSFANVPLNLVWRTALPNPYTKIFAYIGTTSTEITANGTHSIDTTGLVFPTPRLKLNLTSIVEGLYYPLFNSLSRRDTLTVDLRENISPFNLVTTSKAVIDSLNFSAFVTFSAPPGTYYIVLKHFNSIETWSKTGVTFDNTDITVNYDFTTSITQAYGDNLKLKGSKYCIYSGDVDQDGYIDASDVSAIDNDVYNSVTGLYIRTDLNGDNIADAADLQIWDNNRRNIGVISPLNSYYPNNPISIHSKTFIQK